VVQQILGHLCDYHKLNWDCNVDYFMCLWVIARGYNPPNKTTCRKWLELETLPFDIKFNCFEEYTQWTEDFYVCKMSPGSAVAIGRVDGTVGLDVHKVLTCWT
jgi:hypothetical protein